MSIKLNYVINYCIVEFNLKVNRFMQQLVSLLAVFLLLLWHGSIYCRLKYLDPTQIHNVMDLSKLLGDKSIVIEKEKDLHYYKNVTLLTQRCSRARPMKGVEEKIDYKICRRGVDRHMVKVLPAADESDLYPNITFPAGKEWRLVNAFAPHLVMLEDVALYGHGDIMDLDGTSHYLGACRQYGPGGYDSIDVKRKDVVFFGKPVVNLVTLWTENYFNALVAFVPRVLSLMALLDKNPGITIAKNMYPSKAESFMYPILEYYDMHPKKFNLVNIEYGKVHFAKYLISPISSCKFIPRQFVKMIRAAVTDLYKVDTSEGRRTIVVNDRSELDPLYAKLMELYSDSFEIVKFKLSSMLESDDLDKALEHTAKLFARCRLFISPHGAALTNIVFMQPGAAVIEIRPEDLYTWHFSYLCSMVGVLHHPYQSRSEQSNKKTRFNMVRMLALVQIVMSDEAGLPSTMDRLQSLLSSPDPNDVSGVNPLSTLTTDSILAPASSTSTPQTHAAIAFLDFSSSSPGAPLSPSPTIQSLNASSSLLQSTVSSNNSITFLDFSSSAALVPSSSRSSSSTSAEAASSLPQSISSSSSVAFLDFSSSSSSSGASIPAVASAVDSSLAVSTRAFPFTPQQQQQHQQSMSNNSIGFLDSSKSSSVSVVVAAPLAAVVHNSTSPIPTSNISVSFLDFSSSSSLEAASSSSSISSSSSSSSISLSSSSISLSSSSIPTIQVNASSSLPQSTLSSNYSKAFLNFSSSAALVPSSSLSSSAAEASSSSLPKSSLSSNSVAFLNHSSSSSSSGASLQLSLSPSAVPKTTTSSSTEEVLHPPIDTDTKGAVPPPVSDSPAFVNGKNAATFMNSLKKLFH